jgi:hypothetical protein
MLCLTKTINFPIKIIKPKIKNAFRDNNNNVKIIKKISLGFNLVIKF